MHVKSFKNNRTLQINSKANLVWNLLRVKKYLVAKIIYLIDLHVILFRQKVKGFLILTEK